VVLSSPSPSFLSGSIRNLNYLRARIFGCLIKEISGMTKEVSPLSVSVRVPQYLKAWIPDKRFWDDRRKGHHP